MDFVAENDSNLCSIMSNAMWLEPGKISRILCKMFNEIGKNIFIFFKHFETKMANILRIFELAKILLKKWKNIGKIFQQFKYFLRLYKIFD